MPVLLLPLEVGVTEVEPGQSPLPVHVVAGVVLLTFHESVALFPTSIEDGLTVKDTVGGFGKTWIAATSEVDPVELLQLIVKV